MNTINKIKNKRLRTYTILIGVISFSFSYSSFTKQNSSLFAQSDGSAGKGPEMTDQGNIGNKINKERHGSTDHNEINNTDSSKKREKRSVHRPHNKSQNSNKNIPSQ